MNNVNHNPFAPQTNTQANSDIVLYFNRVAILGMDCYFSVHHTKKLDNGKIILPGNAHKDLASAREDATYWLGRRENVYLAMCGEGKVKQAKEGRKSPYPAADRTRINAVWAKNFYLDVDVKPNKLNEAYASSDEAVEAINKFLSDVPLPVPTFVVSSGTGGFHVYWTLDRVIPLAEWQKLANALVTATKRFGLKCDTECSVDVTRLLRVAGTLNFKQDPPLPVTIHYDSGTDLSFDEMRKALSPYINTPRALRTLKSNSAEERTQSELLDGQPAEDLDALRGGIKPEYPPSDIDEVAKNCPFIKDTLDTGGAEYAEPLWKYTISLAACCTNPEETAHRLSKEYEDYSPEETDAKLEQAQLDRASNPNLGPPGCEAIQHAGATQCAACPHLALKSNPLNVGFHTPASIPEMPMVGGETLTSTLPPQTLWDTPGHRKEIMEALDRRLANDPYIFQNGERLISLRVSPGAAVLFPHIVDRDASGSHPAVTDEGNMPVMLETTDADVLYLADLDYWMGYEPGRVAKGQKPKVIRKHAPAETCKLYLRLSRAKLGFRRLLGLARVPIIDDAGNLDFDVGYHAATGIFRDCTPVLDIPDNPTLADCRTALNVLGLPFQEYRFEDQALGCVLILALILTALERPFIPTAPMFGINGVAGVGKGKLLRAVSQLAFDTTPRFMTYGFNADEFDKRVGTMFRIPAPCLVIDNANGKRIANDALESIITEGEGHVRTLGKSELVYVVNRSLLVATGRGLEFSGDMTRRELTLNPIATDASPERRTFKLDPPTYAAEHRNEMLTAAFTIMRAYRQAGMPKLAKTSAGSFPEWERRVRDLIMWLVNVDVTDQFAHNREIASDKQADAAVLQALRGIFGNKPFLAKDAQHII